MPKRPRITPPKMADIARLAGVHTSTVSRALAGSPLVKDDVREKILKLARSRGYTMNNAARSLRTKRTQIISVVIPLGHEAGQPLTDPFFQEMLGYLADEITQRGYGLYLRKVLPPMKDWLTSLVASQQSDGILVIGQSTEHEMLDAVAKQYRPLVVWGGKLDHQSYCTVGTDNVAGAFVAVEHLLKIGRRRIVFLGDPSAPEIGLRYEGYKRALARGPKGTSPPLLVPAHLTGTLAFAAMSAFIAENKKFDAVFGATDMIAISAIRAINAAGLNVPRDVSVVGFDDTTLAEHSNPPLTTVRQDIRHGAQKMVDLLFRRMEGEPARSETMTPTLIIRESSGTVARPLAARSAT